MVKIQAVEIPWKDGLPIGVYDLQHQVRGYCATGYGYEFVDGRTKSPIGGRPLARILASHGSEFSVYPGDDETLRMVLEGLRGRGQGARADELMALHSGDAGEAKPDSVPPPAPAPETPTIGSNQTAPTASKMLDVASWTPADMDELKALTEDDLRKVGAQLGFTDKRWGVDKLHREIAKELQLKDRDR